MSINRQALFAFLAAMISAYTWAGVTGYGWEFIKNSSTARGFDFAVVAAIVICTLYEMTAAICEAIQKKK